MVKKLIRRMLPVKHYSMLSKSKKLISFVSKNPDLPIGYVIEILSAAQGRFERQCPICGFSGKFLAKGIPPRIDAWCPQCFSVEKHRLLWLVIQQHEKIGQTSSLLHFAPEKCLKRVLEPIVKRYVTVDYARDDVDLRIDICRTPFRSDSWDVIVCNHVLEHVADDQVAALELYRILKPGGRAFVTVPIVDGWRSTYEDPTIMSPEQRELHFGLDSHVRFYGSDFRERMKQPGFMLREYTSTGDDSVRFGLTRGEKVFVFERPL